MTASVVGSGQEPSDCLNVVAGIVLGGLDVPDGALRRRLLNQSMEGTSPCSDAALVVMLAELEADGAIHSNVSR